MSQSFSNNINSLNTFSVSTSFAIADDRSGVLAWLSPLDPRLRHQDIRDRRVENVGEWLLQTEEYRSWHAGGGSDNAVLFCYGDPGVGKTFISSLVIDSLCDQARGRNATVACFYFDFAAQKEQSSTSMLRALLKQLVGGLEETPEEISRAYQDRGNAIGGRELGLSDIVKMLQTSSSKKQMFICIDALDECVAGYRVKLLDSLNQILQKSPSTRMFVTGRPHIHPEIGRRLAGRVMSVSISPQRDDIVGYIHTRLDEDTNPDAMDGSLEADILKKIPEDISEIFLLVSLNVDAILQETTISRRRQKLNAMTDGLGLGDVYGATLDRIRGQGGEKSRLGMAALMWISHSERPLKADELCHALAVEIGSPNLDADNVPSIGILLVCCQGLVVIDKEASTVRLIHLTLREYLRAHPELFGTAHSTMAETCLSYLNSRQVKALSVTPSPDLQSTPFLEYSSLYWGMHARRDLSDCAKLLALKLFDDYNNHISTKLFLQTLKWYSHAVNSGQPSQFNALHCASAFGIVGIVACLVELECCDINQGDCTGNTPLLWAARYGNGAVVEKLLARDDVNPNKPDIFGQTPLSCAASNGHEEVVKILLTRDDVNPDRLDSCSQTPLCCAAWGGHEGVVKILLGWGGINPNKLDIFGQTPLSWATSNGHEGVVRVLLRRGDINPNTLDIFGQTPFSWAASNGHEGVVEILLGRGDVNPDELDYNGRTPLCCAARNGHTGVVKILLGRDDVNPNKPSRYGETPLSCAAEKGHEGMVEILLGRDDVEPDKPDNHGRTPLCCAANDGHTGVVKILLGRDGVNPNRLDNHGRTPLCHAARNGHAEVVKTLVRWDEINIDKPDKFGRTSLWWATQRGHAQVIALLQPPEPTTPARPKVGRHPSFPPPNTDNPYSISARAVTAL